MRVTLFGASGMIGSRVLAELVSRGHQVTAVVRNPGKVSQPGVTVKVGDVLDSSSIAETAKGSDAVISAYAPPADATAKLSEAVRAITEGLQYAGIRRFLMVGGAGSLDAAPGLPLMDTPNFAPQFKPYAVAHRDALEVLKQADLDWTNLSPAAMIEPGERTSNYRTGSDILLTDAQGNSRISAEDYAVAMVDELERPKHVRQRFTLAY
jgi:putative NADH-flavin reductase